LSLRERRLADAAAERGDRVLFVKGDPTVNLESAAEVIDMSRALGIGHIGVVTPGLEAN
jgi:biopolymer transport protein TolR